MPGLHVVTATDPRLLLEAAAEPFLAVRRGTPDNPFPSPACLLALRQGGLRDDLIAIARQPGVPGWFDPPLCIFAELPQWLGATERRPLTAIERQALLGRLLRTATGSVLGRVRRPDQFIGALDRWLGELAAEGISPEEYESATRDRLGADEFERRRDAELAELYRAYRLALGTAHRDGRDTLVDTAQALRDRGGHPPEAMAGRREISFFGLHDLRGGWTVLLRALQASPAFDRITIYTAYLPAGLRDLDCELKQLDEPATPAVQLFGEARSPAGDVAVIEAPDPDRELEEIARRIRGLHAGGVALGDIAIVVRRARPHGDLAAKALARFGLPATIRQRRAIIEVPVVRALRALLRAADEGWSRHSLVELASQPYFASELDAGVLNHAGFRSRVTGLAEWDQALADLADGAQRREQDLAAGLLDDDGRTSLPPSGRCAAALGGFRSFTKEARQLEGDRPLREWLSLLEDLITRDPWRLAQRAQAVPDGRFDVVRADLLGWEALADTVRDWRRALEDWGAETAALSAAHFLEQLDDALDGDIVLHSSTAYGVQVLEGLAAAYRSFRHVFLAGLEAGQFPVRPPASPLLDETDRDGLVAAGLNIDRRGDWDQRERELFRVLVAGARDRLTLSHARMDGTGTETIPSAYLEAMREVAVASITPIPASQVGACGGRVVADRAALDAANHAIRMERLRETAEPSPWTGHIAAPDLVAWIAAEFGDSRLWSPTQLESYAKCPWAFFSERLLGIEKRVDPDETLEPSVRGTVLHDALSRLYSRLGAAPSRPLLLTTADRTRVGEHLPVALDEALESAEARHWLGNPAFRGAQRAELMRLLVAYLDFEMKEGASFANRRTNRGKQVPTGVVQHEVPFRDATLERNGVRLRYRGFIDRVERGTDDPAFVGAVDYKTSKWGAPGANASRKGDAWEDGVVLQVPLYLHALTLLHPDSRPTRVEYRAIKQRVVMHPLSLHKRGPGDTFVEDEEARRIFDAALDAATAHVQRVRSGVFPAAPPPSCKCPPFCHAWEICRVPGGPQTGGWR